MIKNFKIATLAFMFLGASACTNLDENLVGEITTDIRIDGVNTGVGSGGSDALEAAFAGLRNGFAGHSGIYSLQEVTTDEMVIATKGGDWFDGGILVDLHQHTYKANHDFINGTWGSLYGAVNTCNELLDKTGTGALDAGQRAQVRVLRAFYYMKLMDLYGRVKIIVKVGADAPQSARTVVFDFVEKEILESLGITTLTSGLTFATSPLGVSVNPYRINRFGALGILSQLYLNAEVYRGVRMYDRAALAAGYVIDSGVYRLCGTGCKVTNLGKRNVATDPAELEGYAAVFAPNNESNPEIVFSVFFDGVKAGGMNFAHMNLHYSSQFSYNLNDQPWNGYATLEAFYNSYEAADRRRANNFLAGVQLDFGGSAILDYATDDGNPVLNYTPAINELVPNSRREAGARAAKFSFKQFGLSSMDNDYPIVRLGDMHLIRGEALARNANNWALALPDVNVIRARAGVSNLPALTDITFLAERGREMFQEGARRTDLIRFGRYNGTWWEKPVSTPNKNIFPIPQQQIQVSNGTLTQNPGY